MSAPETATITPPRVTWIRELASETSRNRFRIQAIPISSQPTVNDATRRAVCRSLIRKGSAWKLPPRNVAPPVIKPRDMDVPLPVTVPSSESASERPMLIPAPSAAASPTNNAACEPARNAVAKIGARVETVPSIRPIQGGLHALEHESLLIRRSHSPRQAVPPIRS